jgi:hypothetical protein
MTVWHAGWNETVQFHFTLHNRHSSTQNNKYQVSHKYNCFSWWWAHNCQKHVEKSHKHIKKICAPIWFYLQDYTGMRSQQNIKNGVEKLGREVDYSPQSSVEVKNNWSYSPPPPIRLRGVQRDNFLRYKMTQAPPHSQRLHRQEHKRTFLGEATLRKDTYLLPPCARPTTATPIVCYNLAR